MSSTPTSAESASATARGRAVASKPLNTSTTRSAGASASAGKSKRTPSTASTSSKASASSAKAARAAPSASSSRASSRGSESGGGGFKVTKLSSTTVTINTTWTPRPPQPAPSASASTSKSQSQSQSTAPLSASSVAEQQPTRTSDPLQVAAQVYPWTYMTSTLDACFKGAEAAATNDLETRTKELSEEESELAEQRDRLEAERALDFFEELGTGSFAKEAPEIMQLFHTHGDSCARVETEALKLASRNGPDPEDEEPLKVYNDMLQVLEELHNEATKLHASISKLTEVPPPQLPQAQALPATVTEHAQSTTKAGEPAGPESETAPNTDAPSALNTTTTAETSAAHSQVSSVFASCLPVLRARIANLTMAQELIDTALENVALGLRMESMGIV
ncbi:hypothetical protein BDN70DRAFT_879996 [Pholiota conissans]|uniref:Uncharacterized protein n=1 Tax=Pholiota conissans TaxID=109636 RepID=A0A9P5YZ19_9AGAR|nr:hypothetical protein BDN70DRAFT_879996 [Pholiota conissans]